MKLIGSYKLNVKKEVVWKALNDADILKQQHPSMPVHQKRSSSTTTGKRKTEFSEE